MTLTIRRLHELTEKQLLAFGVWMRGEIQPASITEGSTWVCQALQRPHYGNDEYLALLHRGERSIDIWVGLEKGKPITTCWVARGEPDRAIIKFLVDEALAPVEQVKAADALALQGIEDVLADPYPGKRDLVITMRLDANGEAYATLCGFSNPKVVGVGTPRRISFEALRENILKRHG